MQDTDRPDTAAQLRRALAAVQDMRTRLEAAQAREHEPVAIVGMACRFPGGDDPAQWWETLASGRDAISVVPRERWDVDALYDPDPDAPGRMSTRWGGFVADVDRFDAAFFGISPREATSTDPQQRLLLEATWHALEDAGIAPDRLAGSRTGVFVGLATNDYAQVLSAGAGALWLDAHASTGNSVAVAAGRLAYTLGLQGPAMVIDTACSSSLVAVHQAVAALRRGEIGLALAAGVNLILRPELTIGFSKARMMAADGRCKTFDAAADGYVRGEGCGVVVLKRLADAIAAGDRIHAVVRGSAVNHDGRSAGLTAPNGPAQVAVIQAALADAQVEPGSVSLVEAHGTGTALGDPIEARALGEVYGGDRHGTPAPWLASVKTQVGHLEAAAGIAGLIKVALCLRQKTVAPHLHFRALNPHIAADGFDFRIPLAATPWEPVEGRWIAGVSSFGFSGTNAHVILEAAPQVAEAPATEARPVQVLPVSARDPQALEDLRAALVRQLQQPQAHLGPLAATLGAGRAHHALRIAVAADSAAAAAQALAAAKPRQANDAPALAFLFTGQGCQYAGMAHGLTAEPRFRETLARCDAVLASRLGRPIAELIAPDAQADLARTDILQPVLFALEYAIADLWRSWGVEPAAVLGHSLGEIAAACFAGAMPLEDALAFVAERGRLMQECHGRGGMAAVLLTAAKAQELVAATGVVIAADNAPTSCVIAGAAAALASALDRLEKAGVATQRLEVATAFHSAALDDRLDALERAARAMRHEEARMPVASNLTGDCVHAFDAGYWRRQARAPVRFREGLAALAARGVRLFLEVGPHPVLSGFGRAALPEATFVASLRRGADAARTLAEALAQLYLHGVPVDWTARRLPGERRGDAPRYPFRRERFWPAHAASATSAVVAPANGRGLPAARIDSPLPQHLYEAQVSTATMPFLADHVVFGKVVVPGAMHAVTALAVLQSEGAATPGLEDLVFEQALEVPPEGTRLQLVLEPDGAFALSARAPGAEWVRHASGRALAHADAPPAPLDLDGLRAAMARDEAGPAALFGLLAERGIVLGPAFRGARSLWRGAGEALAEIALPEGLQEEARALPIHPALLDACFQTLGATFAGEGAQGGFLPLSVDRIRAWGRAPGRFFCHARAGGGAGGGQVAVGDFTLCDEAGRVFLAIDGLQIKRVSPPAPADPLAGALLAPHWVRAPLGRADWADPTALVAAAKPSSGASRAEDAAQATDAADGLATDLERLADALAARAIAELGLAPGAAPDTPARAHGIAAGKERLFRRVLQLAAHHRTAGGEPADALEQRLRASYPGNASEIDLVARCGRGLTGVLRGTADPLQLLFPQGDGDDTGIYGGAGLAQVANAMAAAAVAAAGQRRAGRALRVIEVGAGTGATTQAVLPAVAAIPGSHYLFTDLSPAFLKAAQARFGDAVQTALLDIEDARAIGALAGRYDVVVAANVVHATADVVATLRHLRTLLVPGGALVLVESTQAQRWWDIVFGLTDGWWRFADTGLRPEHPLLDAATWRKALAQAGFAASASLGADAEERLSLVVARNPPPPVLVVHDGGSGPSRELATNLCAELERRGVKASAIGGPKAIERLAQPPADAASAPGAVVYVGGIGEAATGSLADRPSLRQAFDLVRAMARSGREGLLLVTRGARGPARVTDAESASLWGLAEVAALEHPELKLARVDLDPAGGDAATILAEELLARDAEAAIAWRDGERHACRLAPVELPEREATPLLSGGTCLVTGAFGGLGPLLAEWLVAQGAGALVLAGRRPPDPAVAARLAALPARVVLRTIDVTDAPAMAALFAEARRDVPPLEAVFHLAGGVADGALIAQDWPRFASVLGAKADGARLLDRLATDATLRHFVLFSTSASLIGNRGQANHAAANACLDALAHERRGRGLPALSINWGAWSGAGAVVAGDYAARMAAQGVRELAPAAGLEALGRAMQGESAQLGVIPLDWPRFLAGYAGQVPAFLSAMAARAAASQRPAPGAARGVGPTADLRKLLAGTAPADRESRLQAFLLAQAAAVLGMDDPARIDCDQALNELGLDSLLALELRNRLGAAAGTKQPATLLFNYPSVAALTRYFAQELIAPEAATPARGESERISEIAALSDAEIEALIDEELGALQKR